MSSENGCAPEGQQQARTPPGHPDASRPARNPRQGERPMAAVPSPLTAPHPPAKSKPLYRTLYFQVLVAVAIGILLGHFYPQLGAELKPLGDAFIKLVKMIIAPVIFLTVVSGIAGMTNLEKVGRVGGKA